MKLNDPKKIEDMLNDCHRDLSFVAVSMGKPDSLSNIFLLNMYLFKALDNEILLWLKNLDNGSIVTLASRNIFELYLILIEVNQNEHSMKRFFAQLGNDRDELNDAFMNKCEAVGYELSDNDKNIIQEELDKSPFENIETHCFRMRYLAKTHGYQEDYDFFYKLSSKLIHPSAYKVLGVVDASPQYEVVAMTGYHFISKATDFAVDFYNKNVVLAKHNT
ncbi:hypothetical protein CXF85_08600 [Colwellia sp. 75C3]|uniref:hypothetical protein n=1 Tax=Colwellia sp. 75C3 TaxID=888425 RepID=UPI000C347146|nr:hypothetical protein [Colwellia sp. 75C3]PKG84373.1 hypothetical protein CXF85_08600 [Colwellia sp. 75C3]